MIIKETTFQLKDGRNALIRSPREEDAQGMLDYLCRSAGETDFLLRYPEEFSQMTAEGEKAFLERCNASDCEAMLVCLVEGEIAGSCQISWSQGLKTRHRASVAIALLSAFWNQGIGTRLFQALIQIAQENQNITQMELDYVEGNSRARALYEKMGFRITGVKPNAIRLKDGTFRNEYSMIREIRR